MDRYFNSRVNLIHREFNGHGKNQNHRSLQNKPALQFMESNNNSGLFGIVEIKVIWFKRCGNELAYPGIVLIFQYNILS